MRTNKAVVDYLSDCGYSSPNGIVYDLIDAGFIEPDPVPELSEPERFVAKAKEWLGELNKTDYFKYASGWSTASWETVTEESIDHNTDKIRSIFYALVILAKETGINL